MLRLHQEAGNNKFHDDVRMHSEEMNVDASHILRGLSCSSFKAMRRPGGKIPITVPQTLAIIIFKLTAIDVTETRNIAFFYQLGFDICLQIDVETQNREEGEPDEHELKNFRFEIYEANAIAEDPDDPDFELDLRIGFDRTRLTIRADSQRIIGNRTCAETPPDPGTATKPDYKGWFKMRLVGRNPLSWAFLPLDEGDVLTKRVDAEHLARIETARGTAVVAEITARREALKVRIVDAEGRKASKSLSEKHRDKMCAAVARRSMAGSADEYVLHRTPLVGASQ